MKSHYAAAAIRAATDHAASMIELHLRRRRRNRRILRIFAAKSMFVLTKVFTTVKTHSASERFRASIFLLLRMMDNRAIEFGFTYEYKGERLITGQRREYQFQIGDLLILFQS